MHRPRAAARLVALVSLVALCTVATPASAGGTWIWPVTGPVLRSFDPPGTPFGSGHRGIDIGAPAGTTVLAPAPGTVAFAGQVGGQLFVTLDHGGGLASTYSWVSAALVRKGDLVVRGQPIARSGSGHPGDTVDSLHLGVKLDGAYVDPLDYLAPLDLASLIRLAPIGP
jgi:murein DD-endopeptidase MepM/ murein hydrolase activator NlpD